MDTPPKTIIFDCLGGDYGIEENVIAVCEIIKQGKISLLLVGPEKDLRDRFHSLGVSPPPSSIEFFDCHEQFSSHRSATEVVKEGKASIVQCLQLLKQGRGHAVVSAGHTGATFVASLLVLGRLPGVHRPALAIVYPAMNGPTVLLDVGANVDCKAAHLVNFVLMGCVYYAHAFKKDHVSVGFLTNGEEEVKGSQAVIQAHQEVQKMTLPSWVEYRGQVDGAEIFGDCPNVLAVDGFVGNLLVKCVESLVSRFEMEFKKAFQKSNLVTKTGFLMSKRVWRAIKTGLDYQEIGGAPLLGVNGTVTVCHGRSNGGALAQAIRRTAAIDLKAYHDALRQVLSPRAPGAMQRG